MACWIVLLLRELWPSLSSNITSEEQSLESAAALLSTYFIRALKAIVSVAEGTVLERLLADFSATLLLSSIDSFGQVALLQQQQSQRNSTVIQIPFRIIYEIRFMFFCCFVMMLDNLCNSKEAVSACPHSLASTVKRSDYSFALFYERGCDWQSLHCRALHNL